MKLIVSPRAEKQLKKCPKVFQIIIVRKLASLSEQKLNLGSEKLSGYKDIFRVRVGNYRIVYRIRGDVNYVVLIAHRKEVYDLLKNLFSK